MSFNIVKNLKLFLLHNVLLLILEIVLLNIFNNKKKIFTGTCKLNKFSYLIQKLPIRLLYKIVWFVQLL